MITDTQKQIAAAKAKLEALEKKAAAEMSKKLTTLHKEVGFATRAELISALQGLEGGAKRGRKPKAAAAASAGKAKKRAKRARITEELKAQVIEAVKAGEKGAAIASKFGISVPSLQNIKKAAGLTKTRGSK
ncbi:helix-turn-helix domain-containing protein [Pelagicoccus albus]|uniref:Helix-turn-helix domain-containing protein n=2 Tax=Pelagicoccus albus TaxID=415222 RepID=A0A7X1B4U7_9BACT|nr:helix-turn-helix domain-containing protein [Pelagicoccus albus]MBC2605637.1 helix-turn-helix domain-containing protein [Pelagicoccus albus]